MKIDYKKVLKNRISFFGKSLIIFAFLSISGKSITYSQDSLAIPYSQLDIVDNDDYSSFEFFNNKLDSFKVIFLGENHYYRNINDDINLKFLKYLHKQYGFNTLALEFGFSRGYLVNEYIQTGDSSILELLEKHSGDSFIEFYKSLFEFNNSLSTEKKIKVIGADVERYMGLAVQQMEKLMPEGFAPDEISLNVEALRGLAGMNDSQFDYEYGKKMYQMFSSETTLENFIEDFIKKDTIYKEWIGNEFSLFNTIALSLKDYIQWRKYTTQGATHGYVFREEILEKSITEYLSKNPDAKIFAQFGRCHVSSSTQDEACGWKNYNSVATRLDNPKNPITAGKVNSMAMFYTKTPELDQLNIANKALRYLDKYAEKDGITVFEISDTVEMLKDYAEHFDFILLNDYKISSTVNERKSSYQNLGFLGVSYNSAKFNLKSLNDFFSGKGFSAVQKIVKFEAGIRENHSLYAKMGIDIMVPAEYDISDSIKNRLDYYAIKWYQGIDLTKSKILDIIPQYGIGFARMKVLGTRIKDEPDPVYNPFKDNIMYRYVNPALVFEIALEMRINIKPLSLGGQVGLLMDISGQRWRSDGELILGSPETTLRHYYFGGYLAWVFVD
ncbi:MAG: erythromycin esterase family protein [Bacteroidales bacterium]|nr:erythromycin esterase family protein [Bacteroidales bacterium]